MRVQLVVYETDIENVQRVIPSHSRPARTV